MKQVWMFQRFNSASFCFIRKEARCLHLVHLRASSEPAPSPPAPQHWAPSQKLCTWCWRISPCQYQHQSQLQSLWRIKFETCCYLLKTTVAFDNHWCGSNSKDDKFSSTFKVTTHHCILFIYKGKKTFPWFQKMSYFLTFHKKMILYSASHHCSLRIHCHGQDFSSSIEGQGKAFLNTDGIFNLLIRFQNVSKNTASMISIEDLSSLFIRYIQNHLFLFHLAISIDEQNWSQLSRLRRLIVRLDNKMVSLLHNHRGHSSVTILSPAPKLLKMLLRQLWL